MNEKDFINNLKALNIDVSAEKLLKLSKYYQLLIEENKKINLTAITEKELVYLKHFYDSLTLSLVYNFNKDITLCDIGTGAGFPGLVLKIFFPHLKIILIDSLNKKIKFLEKVIKELNLKDVTVVNTRVENYAKTNRNKFDVVVARAVAKLNILCELCLPLVKINGYFIAMKGDIKEEIKNIDKVLKKLNSSIEEIKNFKLPIENSIRNLIKIKKEKNIDSKYPRFFSQIKQNPL